MDNEQGKNSDDASSLAPDSGEVQPPRVGAVLREARERLGMSVDDVAGRTKFAPRQIVALEADDFAQLPEIAFVRGFVRSYARLLQLDPAPLLAALPHAPAAPMPVAENTLTEVPFPTDSSARRPNIIWLAAALVVAFALLLFTWLHRSGPEAPKPSTESQVKVETLALPSVEVVPESAVQPAVPSGVAAVTAQTSVAPANPIKALNQPDAKASAEPPAPSMRAAPPVAAKDVQPLGAMSLRVDSGTSKVTQKEAGSVPKSAGALRLEFDDESWVEVTDKDGKVLLSQINPRGSEQNIDGNPPFSLVIGRSASVRLYYKGKQIDLAPHTKLSTARLKLE